MLSLQPGSAAHPLGWWSSLFFPADKEADVSARVVGVIDISKSSARFAVVDLDAHAELAVRKTPNPVLRDGSYPHFDCALVWSFILESIAELNRVHPLDAICVTTHGACAALVAPDGELALPVLDYEYEGPDTERAGYDRVRPDFSETFTPRLPGGLNLGAQLYWQQKRFAGAFEGTRWILPYPQYWGFRLTGIPASEVTSLGCHTDLWNFETDLYSSLVLKQGWLAKMGEVRPAAEVLGIVKPDLCKTLGLRPRVPVHVGIQNSNASLLPHLLEREPPFAVVVSTDTWVTAAAPGGSLAGLDPARDCLANADAFGHAVPSARFMGGREHALLMSSEPGHIGEAAISRVIDEGIMRLHQDLTVNVFVNPFDPVDGVDNDGNGYVDDVHGWDELSEIDREQLRRDLEEAREEMRRTLGPELQAEIRAAMEDVFNAPGGRVVDIKGAPIFSGIGFANGVVRETDGALVVAATRERAIHVLKRGDGGAELISTIKVSGAPDNLTLSDDGRILAAVHPKLLSIGMQRKLGVGRSPSRVIDVDLATGVQRTLFDDPKATLISAATAAVRAGDLLIIGSVIDPGLVVCRGAAGPE